MWLGSLRPDRLAELHACDELAASAELAGACLTGPDGRQARQALILLARASADHQVARQLLEPALFRFPDVLAGIEAPREVMIAVASAIPYPSVALAPAHASLAARIAGTYDPGTAGRASWQDTRATLLTALGRREEALAAIEEAARVYRGLAAARPGVFLERLAASLDGLAAQLSALDRRADAATASAEAAAVREETRA